MYVNNKALVAKDKDFIELNLNMLNRHGIITGATGTGKTITLKVIAETLSKAGVPTIITDVKGDLSGCARPGVDSESLQKRFKKLGIENFEFTRFPVRFWDTFGNLGHPIRITVSNMGPSLLSRVLGLSDAQEGILNIVFKIADDKGMELIDLKDLRSMLQYVAENAKEYQMDYGNITNASVSTILRKLLSIEQDSGELFFGEPSLDINDLMKKSEESGQGYLNIIEVNELIKNPTLYATFLIWLLSSFYELLPEVGDLDKPKAVLFLDEAHLIFSEMNEDIVKKLTQVIKLIRSKGIGVFFISQLPSDIPDDILNQLGNRIQHCLRAYTPKELKAVKVAAESFRENKEFNTEEAILELGTGEALVSFIDKDGKPSIVSRATILPPQSLMSEISKEEILEIVRNGLMETKYRNVYDRETAFEKIEDINEEIRKQKEEELRVQEELKQKELQEKEAKRLKKEAKENESELSKSVKKVANSFMTSVGRQLGNAIIRGILGTKK